MSRCRSYWCSKAVAYLLWISVRVRVRIRVRDKIRVLIRGRVRVWVGVKVRVSTPLWFVVYYVGLYRLKQYRML